MEKKVIKFNLVGAICILILALAIIISSFIIIPKLINKTKEGNGNGNVKKMDENKLISIDSIKLDEEIKEKVNFLNPDGSSEEREVTMRYFKSDLGYYIKFAPDYFYVIDDGQNYDRVYSLTSNEIGMDIELKQGKFDEVLRNLEEERQQLINMDTKRYQYDAESQNNPAEQESSIPRRVGETYVNEINVNGKKAYKRVMVSNDDTDVVYCISKDDNSYYYFHAFCSKAFEKDNLPILEAMLESVIVE